MTRSDATGGHGHAQPQIVITTNPIIQGNIYTGRIYTPYAYRRQRIIAVSVPVIFFILGIAFLAIGITIMGLVMLGISFFFFLFAVFIVRRSRRQEQLQNDQMAVTYCQTSMQQAPQLCYPHQQYPPQPPLPYPPQTYPSQSPVMQHQQFVGTTSMAGAEPLPPSYDDAMKTTNNQKV